MASERKYRACVHHLSDRIVTAQRPIRILDAVKWDDHIKEDFFKHKGTRLPAIEADYYTPASLQFNPEEKIREFQTIERDIVKQLGQLSPVGGWMRRLCAEYQAVVRMLTGRGTAVFSEHSQLLYGSSADVFHAGEATLAQMASELNTTLGQLLDTEQPLRNEKCFSAQEAVDELNRRLQTTFAGCGVHVKISDGIVADAAAGSDYIKLRSQASFSHRDLDMLEAHEGWVHIGTTLNGKLQPVCTFLAKGTPSTTITQEGLAVLIEVLSLRSTPSRLKRLTQRVRAIALAEEGADFLEVYRHFTGMGLSEEEAYQLAYRVFRGGTAKTGPFGKDLSYLKGFVLVYNFLRVAVARGRPELIPLLFCGKITIDDLKLLPQLVETGLVKMPQYLPPVFQDLDSLSALLSFSRFISGLDFARLEHDYADLV